MLTFRRFRRANFFAFAWDTVSDCPGIQSGRARTYAVVLIKARPNRCHWGFFVMTKSNRTLFLSSLISGSVLLASAQIAFAESGNDRVNFRDFREQNPGLDRHAARQMFRTERRNENHGIDLTQISTFGNSGYIRCGTETPKDIRRIERFNAEQNVDRVKRNSFQATETGRSIRVNNGVDLDLTSATRNITLGQGLFADGGAVEITVGKQTRTVTAGDQVTAAEYVAVKQALSGSGQQVVIDNKGAAVGGQVDLGQLTADNDVMRATNLVVSANVTTTGDFGKRSDFRLLGDLNNFGTVYATSTVEHVRSGAIRAENIDNHSNALITSDVNLTLDAAGRISNEGTIASSQGVTFSAGQEINNSGSVTTAGDINFNASIINNAGSVKSTGGNINLNGSDTAALSVNNSGGALTALAGAINLRNTAYSGSYDSTIAGGDLFSRELNVNAGQGLASVHVNELTGLVNETGLAAHVAAATDNLNIGTVCLTGDPTFYNSLGNINITGNLSFPEALTLVAAGNITSADGPILIQAGNDNQGFPITFIAGAAFTFSGGSDSPNLPPTTGAGSVSLSGKASSTGGSIILGNGTQVVARSTTTVPGGDDAGADILFAAFAGKTAGSGSIDTSVAELLTGGRANGLDGNVRLIAGAKSGTGIITGIINTTGGAAAPDHGDVITFNKQPNTTIKKQPVVYAADGSRTSTAEIDRFGKLTKSNTEVRNSGATGIDASGEVLFDAGIDLLINGDIVAGGGINLRAPKGNVLMDPGVSAVVSNDLIELFATKGNIGTDAIPIRIDSANFSAETAKGALINVVNFHSGNVTADFLVAKGTVKVTAPTATFFVSEPVIADDIRLESFDLGLFTFANATNLRLVTSNAGGAPFSGGIDGVERVLLNIAAGIGTSTTGFVIDNAKTVNAIGPTVYLTQNSKKATVYSITADTEARLGAFGSTTIRGASVNNGTFAVTTGGGTLLVDDNITAKNAINLINLSEKGKIAVSTGVFITTSAKTVGQGNIVLSVGGADPNSYTGPLENIDIIETGGTVGITGAGIAGKAPTNTLNAIGALLVINNGAKSAKNIFLNGDVTITADPPVPEGTPTIHTPGKQSGRERRAAWATGIIWPQ
jgi:filamentous hemagglutinin